MLAIKPTRGELLRLRKRIQLATRGRDLLKRKQDALIIEFLRLLKELHDKKRALEEAFAIAQRRLSEARALESDLAISAAALAVQEVAALDVRLRVVAGVKVPVIVHAERSGVPAYGSLLLHEVGRGYVNVVDGVLDVAASETTLRRLLREIRKTKRRTRALEDRIIPELRHARSRIELELAEREREQFSRLKHAKH